MTAPRSILILLAAVAVAAADAAAQQSGIAQRIAALKDGYVELRFPSRPGVCGDGASYIRVGEHTRFGRWSSDMSDRTCVPGPVRVALRVLDGQVQRGRAYVGPASPGSEATVIETSAADASEYLLSLAARDARRKIDDDFVFGAVLGENVVAWPALLNIARAQGPAGRRNTHQVAMFWLGRYAAAKTAGSDDPFFEHEEKDDDSDLKEHAVFVLSQLKASDGIDPMIRVARTHRDPRVREKAIFWLGQSGDPRAIDVFEEILRGR